MSEVTITADPQTGLPLVGTTVPVLAPSKDTEGGPQLREVALPQAQLEKAREAVEKHAESLQAAAVAGVQLSRAIAAAAEAGKATIEAEAEAGRLVKRMFAASGIKRQALAGYDLEKGVAYLYPRPTLVVDNTGKSAEDEGEGFTDDEQPASA